jgi:hypothetical protein
MGKSERKTEGKIFGLLQPGKETGPDASPILCKTQLLLSLNGRNSFKTVIGEFQSATFTVHSQMEILASSQTSLKAANDVASKSNCFE